MTQTEKNKIYKIWQEEDKKRSPIEVLESNKDSIFGKNLEKTFLYEFQKNQILKSKRNYLYNFDMGTGKTYTGIHHYLKYKKDGDVLMIVAPKTKVLEFGWEKSIRKCEMEYNIQIDYDITTYDKFKMYKIQDMKNLFIIIDECHNIKGFTSKRGKFIKELLKSSSGFCLLSGTPYSNGKLDYPIYFDCFKIMDVKTTLKEKGRYNETKFSKGRKILTTLVNINKEIKKLKEFTSDYIKMEDCVELPEMIEKDILIDMSPLTKHFRVLKKDVITKLFIKNQVDVNSLNEKFSLTEMFKKIKTIIPTFKETNILSLIGLTVTECRLTNIEEKCKNLQEIRESTKENIVVFYNYESEKDAIIKTLKKCDNYKENSIIEINGSKNTLPQNTKDITCSTVVVQYKAGAEAIELQFANIVVMFSPTWSYQNMSQAIARVYRIGQTKKTLIIKFKTLDTIEMKIYAKLDKKEDFVIKSRKK